MTNIQRMKSDLATEDRREIEDERVRENRLRNDDLTEERRTKADKIVDMSRLRNDETTAIKTKTINKAAPLFFIRTPLTIRCLHYLQSNND